MDSLKTNALIDVLITKFYQTYYFISLLDFDSRVRIIRSYINEIFYSFVHVQRHGRSTTDEQIIYVFCSG
jgi:hypothetical protein